MGGATRSQVGARSAPPLRSRVALRYRVSCQVFACAHTWQETLSLRATRPLRYVCLALHLLPTGSNVRSVSLCYALLARIVRRVVSRVPAHFIAITGFACIGYRLLYLF